MTIFGQCYNLLNNNRGYVMYLLLACSRSSRATSQNVKSGWPLTGGGRLRELRPYLVKIWPH